MDPGRAAMIAGRGAPSRRDATAPVRDPRNRVSKPQSHGPPSNGRGGRDGEYRGRGRDGGDRGGRDRDRARGSPQKTTNTSYMTEEQLSQRFVAEEDKFVLRQSKKKADIRVRERRAKPVDFLAFHLRFIDQDRDVLDDDDDDVEITVPLPEEVLEAASARQLKELEQDIKSFKTLEKNDKNLEYWTALLALCREYADKYGPQGHQEERLIGSVAKDIDGILSPKSLAQLEALEKQIRAKLGSDEPIDTDYWEQLLRRLKVWKAKATIKKIDEAVEAKRMQLLAEDDPEKAKTRKTVKGQQMEVDNEEEEEEEEDGDDGDDRQGASGRAAAPPRSDTNPFSNKAEAAPPPGTARFATVSNEDFSQATKALYEREVARGVGENEEIFAAEEVVDTTSKPKWADKYRPRKPRYFNRVQMGYEWNKYNQTHYDHDNPPPKVVQGYKFNIFYPELIDKMKAPTYRIIREGGRRRGESFAPAGEEDTCLIRFSAGPPYEDIAFRIVDREWDYSAKRERGFKSSYEKGILQLHFQFKKIYYRK